MMHLGKINDVLDHRITGGSEYQWRCYGPNARYLDYESDHAHASVLFDSKTQVVYEASVNDKDNIVKPYRWLNPEYKDAYYAEASNKGIDPHNAWDRTTWVDLEVADDWLEKAKAVFNGLSFDDRVQVPLELEDDLMLQLCIEAHKRDITLNKMVEHLLEMAIANKV
jgi:hypothetical protein